MFVVGLTTAIEEFLTFDRWTPLLFLYWPVLQTIVMTTGSWELKRRTPVKALTLGFVFISLLFSTTCARVKTCSYSTLVFVGVDKKNTKGYERQQ